MTSTYYKHWNTTKDCSLLQLQLHYKINPFTPKPAVISILLCLTPDDFIRQWGTPGSQWVNACFTLKQQEGEDNPYETSRSAADLQQICFDKNRSSAD